MPPPIVFESVQALDGLDVDAVPRWQMIPVGATKTVRLRHAAGKVVSSSNPAVATITEQPANPVFPGDRILRLSGVMAGAATVQVKTAAGATVASLECGVKARRTVKVGFNFVRDNAGHHTNRVHGSVDGWVATMNRILLQQANVEVKKHSVRNVQVLSNLGKVVRFSNHLAGVPAAQHEWGLVTALRDATADFNVFFVWEYEQDATPLVDHTDAGTMGGNCIFEDKAGKEVGETLAHETGHFLGAADTYLAAQKPLLMYGITDQRGRRISKTHANIMNP